MRAQVARDVAVVLLVHLAAASAIGLMLPHLADLAQVTVTSEGIATSEVEVSKQFNDDGWLIVLGGAAGLVLGLALQLWRGTHEVATILAVTVAALLAALLAAWIAEATGPADPAVVLADAARGTAAPVPVVIDSRVAYLVWPLTAVIGALVALLAPPTPPAGGPKVPAEVSGRPVP